jgi:quercetin dioxygenase-like cupin family protein
MSNAVTYRLPGEGSMIRLGPTEYLVDKATGDDTESQYTVYEVYSAPGSGVPLHEHDWAEAFWVLEGAYEISFVDDDDEVQKLTCEPGTFVHVPGGRLHAFLNVHSDYSQMLSINVPVGLETLLRQVGVPVAGLGAEPEREPLPLDEFRAAFTAGGVRVAQERIAPEGGPGAWKDA